MITIKPSPWCAFLPRDGVPFYILPLKMTPLRLAWQFATKGHCAQDPRIGLWTSDRGTALVGTRDCSAQQQLLWWGLGTAASGRDRYGGN